MVFDQAFMPGREVAERLFVDAVRPLMREHAPDIPYAAALVGPGSEVPGYDTARSMDHDWGPGLTLFLADDALDAWSARLDTMFMDRLPDAIAGFPTRFREFADDPGIVQMASGEDGGMLAHRIRITSVPAFLQQQLGVRSTDEMDVATWLTVPEQALLEITAGVVFHDAPGALTVARAALAWYPDDVWRYRLAAAWTRIAQVEPFVGRAGEVGDDLGSQVIALSLVRDAMRLALLQERRYAPYAKWLGTAFASLPGSGELMPHLDRARHAREWQEREAGIVGAMVVLGRRQNDLALCDQVDPAPRSFWSRPFMVVGAQRFADALLNGVSDPAVRAIPAGLGGIDQYMDSTDALGNRQLRGPPLQRHH